MDIQTRKIEFVQAFLALQNEELILKFEKLLNKIKNTENHSAEKPFSLEEFNERISKAERDFENGRFKTTAEILSKFQS